MVTLLIVVLVGKGLQGMFWPRVVQAPTTSTAAFPDVAAAGAALPFAEAYATWDESHPEARQAALKPLWGGDLLAGWNGHGWQTAAGAVATQVRQVGTTSCVVTVVMTVTRYETADKTQPTAHRQALDVPVTVTAGVGTVSGLPLWVAVPTPPAPTVSYLPATDTALGTSTRSMATAFFAAYGRDTDLSAITAPGSTIAGLGGAVVLAQVGVWDVAPADGDTTQARAVVEWSIGSTTQLTQTYTLILTRTTTAGGSRWQVFSLT